MPRTVIPLDVSARAGQALTRTAADQPNQMYFDNTGENVLIIVENEDAAAKTITFITPQEIDSDLAVEDRQDTIAAGEKKVYGPFSNNTYGNEASQVDVDLDADTSVFISAISIGLV